MDLEEKLYMEMIRYYGGDAKRIQHFMKVQAFSKLIAKGEKVEEKTYEILCAAALVHDIGIKPAEEQYGRCDGKLQEKLGMEPARNMLLQVGYSREITERVVYLVGHHHTYTDIDGMDYQILVEADFLVNLYEDMCKTEKIKTAYDKIFRTETGKKICRQMFGIPKREDSE